VVEPPAERRSRTSALSAAPQRAGQQSGATAVLDSPVGQRFVASGQVSAQATTPFPNASVAASPAPARVENRVESLPAPAVPQAATAPIPAIPETSPILESAGQPPALSNLAVSPSPFAPPVPDSAMVSVAEEDRSAPPPLLREENAVVVEERLYEMAAAPEPVSPLMPITQPIRVSPPPGDLPISRENAAVPGSLPRLDVSLAGQELSGASSSLLGELSQSPGRTRLVLPQPGSAVTAGSQGSFLASSEASSAVLLVPPIPIPVPIPVPLTPPPALESEVAPALEASIQSSEAEIAEGSVTGFEEPWAELREPEEEPPMADGSPRFHSLPLPEEDEPLSLDDLEGEIQVPDVVDEAEILLDPEDFQGLSAPEESEPFEEVAVPSRLPAVEPLNDNLLERPMAFVPVAAMEAAASATGPEVKTPLMPAPVVGLPPLAVDEEETAWPANPLGEGTFGPLLAEQPRLEQLDSIPLAETKKVSPAPLGEVLQSGPMADEDDILDELFVSPAAAQGEKRGLSKTAIMAISSVVGVALFSIIGVYFVINSFLGGLDPAEAYREPDGGGVLSGTEPGGSLAVKPKGVTVPTSAPESVVADPPAVIDPVAMLREGSSPEAGGPGAPVPSDPPAVSFDEKVQQAVNGPRGLTGSVIGSVPTLDLVERPATDFSGEVSKVPAPTAGETPVEAAMATPSAVVGSSASEPTGGAVAPRSLDSASTKDPNFNPPASFPAPGPNDGALGKTHDLIDTFLRAPDWATRVNYTYQGESLRAAIEEYHKKWPYAPFERYSLQLFQIEPDPSLGGPYWVFFVSTSDEEEGFPLIVRTEGGILKVDWEIFAEFSDRHFLRFREGKVDPPATFRLIVERFSDYYGTDKEAFTDLKDYAVFQVNPPYGGPNEFAEYVFVKKDTPIAEKLDGLVRLGDEPLAVVVTLENKPFAHGVKHFVISELLTEGWFR